MRRINMLFVLLLFGICAGAPQNADQRALFYEPIKDRPGPEKLYTGIRVKQNSKRQIYYNEQTIAVVELDTKWLLLNCELIEVKTKLDRDVTLSELKNIKKTKISFENMMDLMNKCQLMPTPTNIKPNSVPVQGASTAASLPTISTIIHGIFPGTKWCGRGDLAENYFELGAEQDIDRCCRTHDFCPIKVQALRTQYNATNYSPITKLECSCDETFYRCLKSLKSNLADILGTLFFNVGSSDCLTQVTINNKNGTSTVRQFVPNTLKY